MEVLTVQQAAEALDVDPKTLYRLIEAGQLPAFKVGRQWRMRQNDLDAWIDRQLVCREPEAVYRLSQLPLGKAPGDLRVENQPPSDGFSDSAFSENSDLPIHRWVPWIAGFSAKFVGEALGRYLPAGGSPEQFRVLDPFAGVGTTLLTAMLRGHLVVGFEINPYAAEVCDLKLSVHKVPVDELATHVRSFESEVRDEIRQGKEPRTLPPAGFNTRRRFLSSAVESKVLLAQDFMNGLPDGLVRKCFRVALGSELVGFSNYSYEPSLGTRLAAGKMDVQDANVVGILVGKLDQMVEDIKAAQEHIRDAGIHPKVELHAGSFFERHAVLAEGTVDLVITSPPYLNNYHYIRNSRPQMYWLGLTAAPGTLREVEQGSFGKYWQTVRGEKPIPLSFSLPELEDSLAFLRTVSVERGPYGGPGWANYAATYFNDCFRFAGALECLLKPGCRAVVVLGNSILQGVEFKTDVLFGQTCELCGLVTENILPLRKKRTGASIIQSSVRVNSDKAKTTLYESAVVLRKRG